MFLYILYLFLPAASPRLAAGFINISTVGSTSTSRGSLVKALLHFSLNYFDRHNEKSKFESSTATNIFELIFHGSCVSEYNLWVIMDKL